MPDLGIDAQIKAVIRELGFRERVYPGWVTKGKMKQVEADLQIMLMKSVLETLKRVKDTANLADSLKSAVGVV